jgi:NADPH-dependent curcumin reductase CurA
MRVSQFEGGKMKNKQVVLAALPKSMVKETDFRVVETETEVVVEPGSNDVAVKLLYIGVESYYRELMEENDALGFGLYKVGQVRLCSLDLVHSDLFATWC